MFPMHRFTTNDGIEICYRDNGLKDAIPIVMIHGFTGSSAVFENNLPGLAMNHRVIAPDLRGHGQSAKPNSGYHVSRLAIDLKNLIDHLGLPKGKIVGIGASLGCAVLWSFSELFTTADFSHMVFVDQAPLQNYTADGSWGPSHGNRSCNSQASLAYFQATLDLSPETAYRGMIGACLGYRSHPLSTDDVSVARRTKDEQTFLDIAKQGNGTWYGKLMADHTSLDWRESICHSFGPSSGSGTKVLVIASERSGCFPAAGPLATVELINDGVRQTAEGVVIAWGGHWCYWEDPMKFNDLVTGFIDPKL